MQIVAQVALLTGQNDGTGLLAQARDNRRHHEAGEIGAHGTAKGERHALPPVHVARHAIDFQEVTELIGNAVGVLAAEGLIHQGNSQLLAGGIRHQARQTFGVLPLSRGLFPAGGA
jgi:hypothetical protein